MRWMTIRIKTCEKKCCKIIVLHSLLGTFGNISPTFLKACFLVDDFPSFPVIGGICFRKFPGTCSLSVLVLYISTLGFVPNRQRFWCLVVFRGDESQVYKEMESNHYEPQKTVPWWIPTFPSVCVSVDLVYILLPSFTLVMDIPLPI